MSFEQFMIQQMDKILPKSSLQLNKLFETDSEVIQFGTEKLLINMDTFSKEDHFREHDFFTLGSNLAVGGISDILASGGTPVFYGHCLTIKKSWPQKDVNELIRGVSRILTQSKIAFIGGDFGVEDEWSYTAVVLGHYSNKILKRNTAAAGDLIYITGKVGAGNLEAALSIYQNKWTDRIKNCFTLRMNEADLIRKYSTCCMDTSDGVFNTLEMISQLSQTGYIISRIPYISMGKLAAKIFLLPVECLFLGECGEYELLFTLSQDQEKAFLEEASLKKINFYKIGKITADSSRILKTNDKVLNLGKMTFRARDFLELKDYIRQMKFFLNEANSAE